MTAQRRCLLLAVVVAMALSGCSSVAITPEAGAALEEHLIAAWEAADEGRADLAAERLDALRERARGFADDGEIVDARLDEILTRADEVEALLVVLDEPEQEPEPESDDDPAPEPEKDDDKGKKKGRDEERDEDEKEEKDEKKEKEEKDDEHKEEKDEDEDD